MHRTFDEGALTIWTFWYAVLLSVTVVLSILFPRLTASALLCGGKGQRSSYYEGKALLEQYCNHGRFANEATTYGAGLIAAVLSTVLLCLGWARMNPLMEKLYIRVAFAFAITGASHLLTVPSGRFHLMIPGQRSYAPLSVPTIVRWLFVIPLYQKILLRIDEILEQEERRDRARGASDLIDDGAQQQPVAPSPGSGRLRALKLLASFPLVVNDPSFRRHAFNMAMVSSGWLLENTWLSLLFMTIGTVSYSIGVAPIVAKQRIPWSHRRGLSPIRSLPWLQQPDAASAAATPALTGSGAQAAGTGNGSSGTSDATVGATSTREDAAASSPDSTGVSGPVRVIPCVMAVSGLTTTLAALADILRVCAPNTPTGTALFAFGEAGSNAMTSVFLLTVPFLRLLLIGAGYRELQELRRREKAERDKREMLGKWMRTVSWHHGLCCACDRSPCRLLA